MLTSILGSQGWRSRLRGGRAAVWVLTALWLLASGPAHAQREYSRWYFGQRTGLLLDGGARPKLLTDGQLVSGEGSAALSDPQGNLLFYTNGIQAWNRLHQPLANGTDLGGYTGRSDWPPNSATQGVAVAPLPGNSSLYYVFTVDAYENELRNGLRYSVVDMNRQGGLGAVTQKAVPVPMPGNNRVTEKLTLVRHANQRDIWVLVHGWQNNLFYAFLLTPNGLSTTPVVSGTGSVHQSLFGIPYYNAIGQMKASRDGRRLATAQINGPAEVFDFNAGVGVVSNGRRLATSPYSNLYGIEFSPNSNLLYATDNSDLQQFDLVRGTQSLVGYIRLGALQLGPDGQIYSATSFAGGPFSTSGDFNLSIIHKPDQLGTACQLETIQNFFPAANRPLLGLPGVLPPPVAPAGPLVSFAVASTSACLGGATVCTAALYPAMPTATISWDFGEPAAGAANRATGPSVQHVYAQAGTYTVTMRVQLPNGGASYTYAQPVQVLPYTTGKLTSTYLCSSQQLRLQVQPTPAYGTTYRWSNGSTFSTLDTKQPGIYWVEFGQPGECIRRDSLLVATTDLQAVRLGPDRVLPCGQTLTLDATINQPGTTYRWQDGSTNPTYNAAFPGTYTVDFKQGDGCQGRASVQLLPAPNCELLLPNIITPNGDGLNDRLVLGNAPTGQYALAVYNRWGRLVYQHAHYANEWDAADQANGLYYYLLTSPSGQRHKGWIEVLR